MENICDHEVWRPVIGYEGLYEVSNKGRVRNAKSDRILKQHILYGYYYVSLNKDSKAHTYRVHRLEAKAFIPNPLNLPHINHRNECKTDNRVENLEWCDAKYNNNYGTRIQRMVEHGNRREVAQYTLDGRLVAIYPSFHEAMRQTGVDYRHIYRCCHGKKKTSGGFIWKFI